jgi:hypothetical protein
MTATELLTRRNADLGEIVEVLRAQQSAKLDVVTCAINLRVADGALRVAGADHELTVDGVSTCDAALKPTASADADLATKLDIPLPYLRRMRQAKTDLYDTNVNAWLADRPERRFLVRGLRDTASTTPGVLRALLSDSYRIVDNLDILMAVLDGIRRTDVQAEVTQADLTESRMYVKVASRQVAEMAPELLAGYRSPFTGASGTENPLVFAGFVVSNSETGRGRFTITPQLVVQVCNNGMTINHHALSEVHLGGKLDEGRIRWSTDTHAAALDLVGKKARDAVATFLDRDFVRSQLHEITAAAGVAISAPAETIEYVAKKLNFTSEQQDAILADFISGGACTSGGVLHAVTSAAQRLTDADAAYEMERQGLRAMSLAATHAITR